MQVAETLKHNWFSQGDNRMYPTYNTSRGHQRKEYSKNKNHSWKLKTW